MLLKFCFDLIQARFHDHPRTPCDLRSMQAMVTKKPQQTQSLPWIILSRAPSENIPCHKRPTGYRGAFQMGLLRLKAINSNMFVRCSTYTPWKFNAAS